jgi:hypothetical protein
VARPSSGGLEVRDDRWGPSVSRARREGEGGAAGGVFLWGRWQFSGAPSARASWAGREAEAQWEEGGVAGWKEKKKKIRMGRGWAERPDGSEVTKNFFFE